MQTIFACSLNIALLILPNWVSNMVLLYLASLKIPRLQFNSSIINETGLFITKFCIKTQHRVSVNVCSTLLCIAHNEEPAQGLDI